MYTGGLFLILSLCECIIWCTLFNISACNRLKVCTWMCILVYIVTQNNFGALGLSVAASLL